MRDRMMKTVGELFSKPVPAGTDEHFRQAKEELDLAREAFAQAESDLIHAQRRYNEASRAFAVRYLEEPVK